MADKNLRLKRKLLTGAAVAAVATGGTVAAVGATGGAGKHPARHARAAHAGRAHSHCLVGPLQIAAGYLGVSREKLQNQISSGRTLAQVADATPGKSAGGLVEAIVSARRPGLDKRIARGKLKPAKRQAAIATLTRRVTARINKAGACAPAKTSRSLPDLAPAARYLGIQPRELRAKLRSGQSIAQVADATSGKSAAALIAALSANRTARLAAAAAAGKITRARERSLMAGVTSRVTAEVDRPMPASPIKQASTLSRVGPVASYLGLRPDQLKAALHSGRTLAQVADATPGKSAAGLIAALIENRRAKLAAALSAGRLSAARENQLLAQLPQRIAAIVNGKRR